MTRKSLPSIAGFAYFLMVQLAQAGDIFFTAEAQINAVRDDISGFVDIKLQSSEWIYNPIIYGRAEGKRQELARFTTWAQNDVKHIEFSLPSAHRAGGDYHLLLEVHFQDMGGATLSANLAVAYKVKEHILLSTAPKVEITGTNLQWRLAERVQDGVSFYVAAPPYVSSAKSIYTTDAAQLDWIAREPSQMRPNWRYPMSGRLDWVENTLHGSRMFHWNLLTDENGKWISQPTAADADAANGLNVQFSAEASLTASPNSMQGTAQIRFENDTPIRDVTITTADANGVAVVLSTLPEWTPGTTQEVKFNFPLPHAVPGAYFFVINLNFTDEQGFPHSGVLALEYSVDRAVVPVTPPTVNIEGDKLIWNLGGADPRHIRLDLTSSPAWNTTAPTLTPADSVLQLAPAMHVRATPNWRYPQLARLSWVADSTHYSAVSEWMIVTDGQGRWSPASANQQDASNAVDGRPWWRRTPLLWFGAVILVGFAVIFGVMNRPPANK